MPFNFKNVIVSARPMTIADEDTATTIAALVRPDPNGFILIKHLTFAEFQVAAEITQADGTPADWPIPHITADDPPADVQAAYAAWQQVPRAFVRKWRAELERAEEAAL